eukprot:SAG11_NODE_10555_length_822_cov_0.921162_2_plen_66_part_00
MLYTSLGSSKSLGGFIHNSIIYTISLYRGPVTYKKLGIFVLGLFVFNFRKVMFDFDFRTQLSMAT